MNEGDAVEILRATFLATVVACGPALLAALVTGLIVSVLQALTQVQEMTLAYVPKIAATLITALVTLPLAFSALRTLMEDIAERIVGI